jgi:hypothetical protein
MLTNKDKNHIRLEETFRLKAQKQLETQVSHDSGRRDAWTFVNSAFFLWFLSTVLIGTISFLYTRWDNHREVQRRIDTQKQLADQEKALTARKLDTEISSRLRFVNGIFETEDSFPQDQKLIKILFILEKPSAIEYPVNVFPEYAERSFQSLLWELKQVVPEEKNKELKVAYEKSKELTSIYIMQTSRTTSTPKVASRQSRNSKRHPADKSLHDDNEAALKQDWVRLMTASELSSFNLERWGKPLTAPGIAPKDKTMTKHARGTFDVKLSPQPPDDKAADSAVGRYLIEKQFQGDLEGTSRGQMLGANTTVETSKGYVALEQVTATLDGRRGTFVLQHSGTMTRGALQLSVSVVPDSGTGELAGLTGKMEIKIEGGKHYYDFEYTLGDDK